MPRPRESTRSLQMAKPYHEIGYGVVRGSDVHARGVGERLQQGWILGSRERCTGSRTLATSSGFVRMGQTWKSVRGCT